MGILTPNFSDYIRDREPFYHGPTAIAGLYVLNNAPTELLFGLGTPLVVASMLMSVYAVDQLLQGLHEHLYANPHYRKAFVHILCSAVSVFLKLSLLACFAFSALRGIDILTPSVIDSFSPIFETFLTVNATGIPLLFCYAHQFLEAGHARGLSDYLSKTWHANMLAALCIMLQPLSSYPVLSSIASSCFTLLSMFMTLEVFHQGVSLLRSVHHDRSNFFSMTKAPTTTQDSIWHSMITLSSTLSCASWMAMCFVTQQSLVRALPEVLKTSLPNFFPAARESLFGFTPKAQLYITSMVTFTLELCRHIIHRKTLSGLNGLDQITRSPSATPNTYYTVGSSSLKPPTNTTIATDISTGDRHSDGSSYNPT